MRVYSNPADRGDLFFDNLSTPGGVAVAYDPDAKSFRIDALHCANRNLIDCNWIANPPGVLCQSCAMTALAPDLSIPSAVENWTQAEAAKRWVLDNLRNWHWFGPEDAGPHPIFHMLAEGANPVVMGHANGVVTISVEEANAAVRAGRREALNERFRTMIGHMRHEIAHFVWWRLSTSAKFLEEFRSLFGDEQSDYSFALERYYQNGPQLDWKDTFLSPYASAHPHEDWAETMANLLHLVDITDSFHAANLTNSDMPGRNWDAYKENDAAIILNAAITITLGINHVNRSMGLQDLYPFVISDVSRKKLEFVHYWLRSGPARTAN